MYLHFRLKEGSTDVHPTYMKYQEFINDRMRSILVDWFVEVHLKYKLVPETLYLAVNIIDVVPRKDAGDEDEVAACGGHCAVGGIQVRGGLPAGAQGSCVYLRSSL